MLTLLAFLLAIFILVSLHEWGHFIVARLFNIKVLRFSIGFGKPFWSKKIGDTEWAFAPFPLGGYVKMVDTREGEVAPEDLPYAFDKQHPAKRIAVVLAGPLMNLALAVLFFTIAALFGITEVKPMVGTVVPDTLAARSGFVAGDRITAVNGKEVLQFSEAMIEMTLSLDSGRDIVVKVQDAQGHNINRIISLKDEESTIDEIARGKSVLGLIPNKLTTVLMGVTPEGAAYRAGLRDGDKILAIDGVAYDTPWALTDKIRQSPSKQLMVDYEREGKVLQAPLRPIGVEETPDLPLVGKIGTWWAEDKPWMQAVMVSYKPSLGEAFLRGWRQTVDYSWMTLKFFGKMLIGDASVKHISGPVTIADLAGKTAAAGLQSYISFLALISLSLGVLNLVPIPVLDGGHLLYYSIEWIRGKPLSERVQEFGIRFGVAAMVLLMCIAFFNDMIRLLG